MSGAIGEPYRLAAKRLAFTSWFHVLPAQPAWFDRTGERVYVVANCGLDEARLEALDGPFGVGLTVCRAERTEPILTPVHSWEKGGIGVNSLLHDSGVYRAWAGAGWGDLEGRQKPGLGLYESDDGLAWRRVFRGREEDGMRTNLVHNHGGFVFRDPAANASERYKLMTESWLSRDEFETLRGECGFKADYFAERHDINRVACVKGAVSPDGITWTALEKPLLVAHSDTLVTAEYDTRLQRYVGYFRSYMMGTVGSSEVAAGPPAWIASCRRSIGRAETTDFRQFPIPELSVVPPLSFGPSRVLYTNAKTTLPGAPDHHLMFPTVWDQANDGSAVFLGVSHDNKTWQISDTHPVLETGPAGAWDGGCVFASPHLVELPDGSFVLPYVGYNVPHKYPRGQASRGTAYARWPKGRLAGITASEKGFFSTVGVDAVGTRLRLNAAIARGGFVEVELAGVDGTVVSGRSFADCRPLMGDCLGSEVVWKNHADLGVAVGAGVRIRFRLAHATIFGLEFA